MAEEEVAAFAFLVPLDTVRGEVELATERPLAMSADFLAWNGAGAGTVSVFVSVCACVCQ